MGNMLPKISINLHAIWCLWYELRVGPRRSNKLSASMNNASIVNASCVQKEVKEEKGSNHMLQFWLKTWITQKVC